MSHPQQLGLRENSQMSEVKLRLMGFPEDVEAIAAFLHNSLKVVEESTEPESWFPIRQTLFDSATTNVQTACSITG